MIKKRILLLLCLVFLVIVFYGCQTPKDNNTNADTHVVKDCIGREVVVPNEVLKAASLDAFSGQVMVMIGAGERMVAAQDGVKRDKIMQTIYPDLVNLPTIMSGGNINAEALLNLDPDLIFVKHDTYVNDGETEKLEKLGIPYLVVNYDSISEQIYAIEMIGQALGGNAQTKTMALKEYYQDVLDLAKERSAKIPETEKLRVYHSMNEAVRTDSTNSLGSDWITRVGAINVSTGEKLRIDGEDAYANLEQIFVWDPDLIICNDVNTMRYILTDSKWAGLRAVNEKKVYNIPIGATRWGHFNSAETFLAMLWLGTTIYPDYYGDIDFKQEVIKFYKDYLGLEINDETYAQMLSGEGIRTSGDYAGQ
ncbi:MAG: ABC transporter substrate-binding protein [Bacillota bacterium]